MSGNCGLYLYSLARMICIGFTLCTAIIGANADIIVIATTMARSITRVMGSNIRISKSFSMALSRSTIKLSPKILFASPTARYNPIEDRAHIKMPANSTWSMKIRDISHGGRDTRNGRVPSHRLHSEQG